MRCDEIEQALDGDMAEFKAAARHIKKCPYCSKMYKDELEMEYSLRGLSLQEETVNIIPELHRQLRFQPKKVNASTVLNRLSWLGAVVFIAGIIIFNLGKIVHAINKGFLYFESLGLNITESDKSNLSRMIETFKSSDYYNLVIMVVAGFTLVVFYYLWREFKEITK